MEEGRIAFKIVGVEGSAILESIGISAVIWIDSAQDRDYEKALVNVVNLREKFLPGPGFEPGSPALHTNQLSYPGEPLGQARILFLLDPHYPPDQD